MCGLAFSGKSTLARKIADHTGSKLIAFDKLWVEKDNDHPVSKNAEGWKFIRKVAQDQVAQSLRSGISVVYDDNNIRHEHREELKAIARDQNVKSLVVYLDTPIDLIREREAINRSTGARHEVEPENFQTVLDQLQPPTSEENPVIFTPGADIVEWLKKLDKNV